MYAVSLLLGNAINFCIVKSNFTRLLFDLFFFWNDKKIQRVLDTVKIFAYNRKCIFGAKFQTTIQIKDVFDYVVGQVSPSD